MQESRCVKLRKKIGCRKILIIFVFVLVEALFLFGRSDVWALEDEAWDFSKEFHEKAGAFTYHAYISKNENEAWIYKISINNKSKAGTLSIPKKLSGKLVTRLGYINTNPEEENEGLPNIFGIEAEPFHNWDASTAATKKIKNLKIPNSVTVIQPTAFSGMDSITSVTIPAKVKAIQEFTFYGCDRLKTVKLPSGIQNLSTSAFQDCPKLRSLKFSSRNKAYEIKDKCLIYKKDRSLLYVMPGGQELDIPKGVKTIKENALHACTARKVHIPASVTKIEGRAFHVPGNGERNASIRDVTIAAGNKTYARDGQCIYKKADHSLAVAIVDENSVLRISDKVTRLTDSYSIVYGYRKKPYDEYLEKVYFPKHLKVVIVPGFSRLSQANKVYFTGDKPPKVQKRIEGNASLPIFTQIYVPKHVSRVYKKWYKQHKDYQYVEGWHTFSSERANAL